MRERADNIETATGRAIYSDDPDAIEQLQPRIASAEAERNSISAYNASVRRGVADTSLLTEAQRNKLQSLQRYSPELMGSGGTMPPFVASNLGANIRRMKQRLQPLQRRQ